jgi:hypothetical protein
MTLVMHQLNAYSHNGHAEHPDLKGHKHDVLALGVVETE